MFSPLTWKLFQESENAFGTLPAPDRQGWVSSIETPPYFRVQLQVRQGSVQVVKFFSPRCVAAMACGTFLVQKLNGQTLAEASLLTTEDVLHGVGGLPATHIHYAWMAISALRQALKES